MTGGNIFRASVQTFAAQVLGAASAAGIGIFLARALGTREFGAYALAFAMAMVMSPIADFGLTFALARRLAGGRDELSRRTIVDAFGLKIVLTTATCLTIYFLAGSLGAHYSGASRNVFRAAAVAIAGQSFLSFIWSALIAARLGGLNFTVVAVRVAAEVSLTLTVVASGYGAAGATLARGAAYAIASVIGITLLLRMSSPSVVHSGERWWARARSLMASGAGLALVEIAYGAFFQVDVLMLGLFVSAASVGIYQAPLRLVGPIAYLGVAIASGVAPSVARERDPTQRRVAVVRALSIVAVAQAAITAVLAVTSGDLVRVLFGPRYRESAEVLRLLLPYVFVASFAPMVSLLVTYIGRIEGRLLVAGTALGLNVIFDLSLIPRLGVNGAAFAADVAAIYYVGGHAWLVGRMMQLRLRPIMDTVLRALTAGCAFLIPVVLGRELGINLVMTTASVSLGVAGFSYAVWRLRILNETRIALIAGEK